MNRIASLIGFSANWSSQKSPRSLPPVLVVVATLLFAFLSAIVTALFGWIAGLAICTCIMSGWLLLSPRTTVWVTIVGALAVAGLVELYLPAFQAVRWVFAGLSVCLAGISFVHRAGSRQPSPSATPYASTLAITLGLFLVSVCLATVSGRLPMTDAIVGLKNYFQMWGLLVALAWLGYTRADASRFIAFLGWLAVIQLPFVLHQYFVLVPQRSGVADAARNIVAVDIVAGTFGGNMVGGGRSADLAVLVVIAIVFFFAQWRNGRRGLTSTVALTALAFAPILLNEAKLALVLLPVGLLLLFRDNITRRPLRALAGAVALAGVLALVVVGYANLPGAANQQSDSVSSFIASSIDYNLGDKGYGSAVLNRSTVYGFWVKEHVRMGDIIRAAVGHGPGFSNATAIKRGDNPTASRYIGYAIGLTGLSTLLWDTGLLGTTLLVSAFVVAYKLAGNLLLQFRSTSHEAAIKAAQIAVVLLGISLFHNEYISFDVGFQTMLSVVFGYLLAMSKSQTMGD